LFDLKNVQLQIFNDYLSPNNKFVTGTIQFWVCSQKLRTIQQFASNWRHKPQTFSRVCLRLKRGVYRWKLKCFTAHVTCHIEKPFSYFWRNCHVLMCLRARFNISKPIIIRSSHKKYEYKQVWSLLQYRELGNTETYTKSHQNMKNNWIRPLNYRVYQKKGNRTSARYCIRITLRMNEILTHSERSCF
jgi:hypothetical protein